MFKKFSRILFLIFATTAALSFPNFAHAAEYTGFGVQFDVQPRLIQNNTAVQLRITFKGNVANQYSLSQYCSGGTLNAAVIMPLDINQTDTYGTDDYGQTAIFRKNVQASGISNPVGTNSLSPGQRINWDFNQNYTHSSAANYRLFQAVVTCGGKEVARSSIVQVNITTVSGNLIYACVADDGKYACSPGNKSDLSDVPACSGKRVIQVLSSVCGQPTTGGGGTGGGTGGGDQGFSFSIPNPLKGGAEDLGGLVKVIAQWLFNLAIPIAVIMIIYAGILFLTARGNPTTITKAKDVLKWAVVGLAIILIGSGFVTLIQSILELGSPPPPVEGPPGPAPLPIPVPGAGAVGNYCGNKDSNCLTGLKCKNTICQRPTGNWVGEPCVAGASCDVGLSCDKSGDAKREIDGQILGTCFVNSQLGGRIGDLCEKDSNCLSGLKCKTICQRKDGNLNGEVCVKTADNCKSNACSTTGSNLVGTCVANPTN